MEVGNTEKSELLDEKLFIVENVDGPFNAVAFCLKMSNLRSAFDLHNDNRKGCDDHQPSKIEQHIFDEKYLKKRFIL